MQTSRSSEAWLFDSGSVALDFVNTLRDRAIGVRETLPSPEALREWLIAAGLLEADTRGEAVFVDVEPSSVHAEAIALREAIDAVLAPDGDADILQVRAVNHWARRAPAVQLDENDPGRATRSSASVAEALGVLAAEAVEIVVQGERERVKICSHERCGLRYLDRSRAGGRRWCSMQRCGNRAKAARHSARERG